ncbi:MAG: DUF1254 domain-containing protein [bacterium]|nr:DUF1254 domain-containing protein [bacterium]
MPLRSLVCVLALGFAWSARAAEPARPYDFERGYPSGPAATQARDDADFARAIAAYRFWYPTVSMEGVMAGLRASGAVDGSSFMFFAASPVQTAFTANSDTPYGAGTVDLRKTGPLVIDLPPGPFIGVVDDHDQQWVMDVGLPGPDAGKGGKHLVVPPGWDEAPPEGYFVGRSPTNRVYVALRAMPVAGDTAKAIAALKTVRVHPLDDADAPFSWIDGTNRRVDATCLQVEDNIGFWRWLHAAIEDEPLRVGWEGMYGLLGTLGLAKGKPFEPDARMQRILGRAARAARDQMLVSGFDSARPDRIVWPDRRWEWIGLVADNGAFETPSGPDLEAADRWFIQAILTSPAMFRRSAGAGSLYWLAARDATGAWLDGGKHYRLRVPAPVPANLFWSVTAYDSQTRSQVQTRQDKAALRSLVEKLTPDADGVVELWFGPEAPAGKEDRWIQTAPGRGWFAYFRIYGPQDEAFDGSWKPGDFEAAP